MAGNGTKQGGVLPVKRSGNTLDSINAVTLR